MLNILSIKCGLAYVPYFLESAESFLKNGEVTSRVVRQSGNGLIIRSTNELLLRHQNREAALSREDVRHYFSTVQWRSEIYDVVRKSDEVIFANFARSLFLSHPQSEIWIDAELLPSLMTAFNTSNGANPEALPDWLQIAGGDGRLLLSDQRNGRWVLLGSDHFAEFDRRYKLLAAKDEIQKPAKPPTIWLKGLKIHLQAAKQLAQTFEEFAETGAFTPYEEIASTYQLIVLRSTEGMKISDSTLVVTMTAREARKWLSILRTEMDKFNLRQTERGNIRTVRAKLENGCWILQWGDEVFLSVEAISKIEALQNSQTETKELAMKRNEDFFLILEKLNGGCVALTDDELKTLLDEGE
jgi:hypothetical protein